jgi:hypothetical protein
MTSAILYLDSEGLLAYVPWRVPPTDVILTLLKAIVLYGSFLCPSCMALLLAVVGLTLTLGLKE